MLRTDGSWDIRCPGGLFKLRERLSKLPNGKPRPYYWKVGVDVGQQIVDLLSRAYRIKRCRVKVGGGHLFKGLNGLYTAPVRKGDRPTMFIHGRAHMKTVFHEFYHHLDWATDGAYDSADHKGGASSYGWQFADRLWNVLTAEYAAIDIKVKVYTDGRGPYIECPFNDEKRLRPLGRHKAYHPGTYVHAAFKRVPASSDYTASVKPWYAHEQNTKDPAELWSSVQSQFHAAKPAPPAKKLAGGLTAGQRKRRIKATRLLAAGLNPDPRDLGIKCSEEGCKRGAKFKGSDEMWRCGSHHKRFIKLMENAMTTKTEKTTKSAAKAPKAKAPAKSTPKAKTEKKPAAKSNGDWRAITLKPNAKITILAAKCPYSGKRAKRWTYKNGMTVEKAIEAGARPADVKYDIGHGRISAK